MEGLPSQENSRIIIVANGKSDNGIANQVKPKWLKKLDEMRKNLKLAKRCTY